MRRRFDPDARPVWEDISSYSQGDKERVPNAWTLRLSPHVSITIVRNHLDHPDSWVMHREPWFHTRDLHLPSAVEYRDEVMARAVALVREQIANVAAKLREVN